MKTHYTNYHGQVCLLATPYNTQQLQGRYANVLDTWLFQGHHMTIQMLTCISDSYSVQEIMRNSSMCQLLQGKFHHSQRHISANLNKWNAAGCTIAATCFHHLTSLRGTSGWPWRKMKWKQLLEPDLQGTMSSLTCLLVYQLQAQASVMSWNNV